MRKYKSTIQLLEVIVVSLFFCLTLTSFSYGGGIKISSENPRYFEYDGKAIFLNGVGPWIPYSEPGIDYEHWHDQLVEHKGNAIRTIVSWPAGYGHDELPPWVKNDQGKFDLNTFNNEFWGRFDDVLSDATSKGIFTLLQIWCECQLEGPSQDRWDVSPWNPANNVNYTSSDVPTEDGEGIPGFYNTLPTLNDRPKALNMQKKYFDKILEATAPYAHRIIYILGNEYSYSGEGRESHQGPWDEWPKYWRNRIKNYNSNLIVADQPMRASRSQAKQYFTKCRMDSLCMMQSVGRLFEFEDFYADIAGKPKPLLFSKNPGNGVGEEAIDQIWKCFCRGAAGCRYHHYWEPPSMLTSMERNEYLVEVIDHVPLVQMTPRRGLIGNASGQHCLAAPGKSYVIYKSSTSSGSVKLDLSGESGGFDVERHDTRTGSVVQMSSISGGGKRSIGLPSGGPWALLIRRSSEAAAGK